MIIVDFKQDLELEHGPNEVGNSYYNRSRCSCLGFVLFTKKNGILEKHRIGMFSRILSKNSAYAIECIENLVKSTLFNNITNLKFWFDCGPHFKSGECIHYILNQLNIQTELNYFVEHHGKSDVDTFFSWLQNAKNEIENVKELNTIDDLINALIHRVTMINLFNNDNSKKKFNVLLFKLDETLIADKTLKKYKILHLKHYYKFEMKNNSLYGNNVKLETTTRLRAFKANEYKYAIKYKPSNLTIGKLVTNKIKRSHELFENNSYEDLLLDFKNLTIN